MRKILLSTILAAAAMQAVAQHPFNTQWNVLKTNEAKIIYPVQSANTAAVIAGSIQKVVEADTLNMHSRHRRMPIIISPTSTTTNGYTTMLPYKMFLYTKPADHGELSGMYWQQNLLSHEYRHIAQYNQFNKGLARLAHCVIGYYGWAGLQYHVPQWYYEGDAVYAETVTSSMGRGRSALFEMPVSALILEKERLFPYDKAVHRSYRDMVPTQYPIGYFLVTGARRNFGSDIFARTSDRQRWYSFWPTAFGRAFHHETGIKMREHYERVFGELRDFYKQRISDAAAMEHHSFSPNIRKTYTSYRYPKILNDSTIICVKSSMGKTSRLIAINLATKKERAICNTDASTFSTDGKIAVYATVVPDMRWSLRDYSNLAIVDIKTGKTRIVTSKERIFEPSISADGRRIVATSFSEGGDCSLVVFESYRDGINWNPQKKTTILRARDPREYLRQPIFLDDNRIAYIQTFANKNSIRVLDLRNNTESVWLEPTSDNIQDISRLESAICYVSDQTGISNLFAVKQDGSVDQLSNSRIGASAPCGNYRMIFFNEYTSKGYKISGVRIGELEMGSISRKTEYYKPLLDDEANGKLDKTMNDDLADANKILEQSRKYHQYSDPIRFLGWMPNADMNTISVSAASENNLETLNISASATYTIDHDYTRGAVAATYNGFWPVLSVSASIGEMADGIVFTTPRQEFYTKECRWREHLISGTVTLPFNLSRLSYAQRASLAAGMQYYIIENKPIAGIEEPGNGNYPMLTASASYSRSKKLAYRDFKSPLAISASVSAIKPVTNRLDGGMVSAKISGTVPGFFSQHYLTVTGDIIAQKPIGDPRRSYIFNHAAFDLRGYESMRMERMQKLTAEYAFPMGYPDFGIPSLIWIKRLRGSITGDLAHSNYTWLGFNYASVGARVMADFCVLRINQEITAGIAIAKGLRVNGLETTEVGLILNLPIN